MKYTDAVRLWMWIWQLGLVFGVFILLPVTGRPAYCLLTGLSGLVAAAISFIMLTVIFCTVFIPVSAILKLSSKDLLERKGFGKANKDASWWHEHREPATKSQYQHLS